MNRLFKNIVSILSAGVIAAASLPASAFALDVSGLSSVNSEVAYGATVAKPTYAIKGDKGVRRIRLTSATAGAEIHYTKDGTTPTAASPILRAGYVIKITATTKIKAIAIRNGEKSAVMTKTVTVPTKYGDVTGDGNINSNDYTRLTKYLAGTTSYVCLDNADVDGNGSVTRNDLTLLSQYLNKTISSFPAEEIRTATLTKPTVTVYKTYGGKRIEISADRGSTIYYTTNGTEPTIYSNRYTNPFTITSDTTIKAIAYEGADFSNVKSRSVTVDPCADVVTDVSSTTTYTNKINVRLSCATASSRIYYTLDGSDPRTSNNTYLYSGAIEISKNTTLKAFAQAKGFTDSNVKTYDYRVTSNMTISGIVWDDTPTTNSVANGVRASNESGIGNIKVALYDTVSGSYPYITRTASDGSYSFANVTKSSYKVVVEYNYMKYRAYPNVVSNGNQAVPTVVIPAMYINNTGIFTSGSSSSAAANINSYNNAITNDKFLTKASTNTTYTTDATNVNCALISNCYGNMKLSLSQNISGTEITSGSDITYTITLTNDSPTETLLDAEVYLYVDTDITAPSVNETTRVTMTSVGLTNSGFSTYKLTGICGTGIAPGYSAKCTVTGRVSGASGATVMSCAEVTSYRYASSCYDKNSIPGNMTVGVRAAENDEAMSTSLTIKGTSTDTSTSTTNKKLEMNVDNTYKQVPMNSTITLTGTITNGENGTADIIVALGNSNAISYVTYVTPLSTTVSRVEVVIVPKSIDLSLVTIKLKDDPNQSFTQRVQVIAAS